MRHVIARSTHDIAIHERSARGRLKSRAKPYWRVISEGFHLGYYKGARKASWVVRLGNPGSKFNPYTTATLGEADDTAVSDGEIILSWKEALALALEWKTLREKGPSDTNPDITVKLACEAYIEIRDKRRLAQVGRAVRSDASYKLTRHVLSDTRLAGLALANLSEADLIAWQARLTRLAPDSRQRIVNDLKAALNAAFAGHRKVLPRDLPVTIKYGLSNISGEAIIAQARDNQILTDDEVRRVVAAAFLLDPDFGLLVLLLAATGARFSQLRRMTVADVQPDHCRLMIPQSFKGKRKVVGHNARTR